MLYIPLSLGALVPRSLLQVIDSMSYIYGIDRDSIHTLLNSQDAG